MGLNTSSAQNFSWISPNTPYLKFYVIEDGIYRINKSDFINAGINPNNIDPRTVKLFYKGNQQPIYFEGEQDGVFNDSDYFDFYGKRNYGGTTVTYKELGGTNVVDYITDEYFNLYSDTNVYWVGWGGNYGLRFEDFIYTSSISYPNNYYFGKVHFERDLIYSLGEKISPTDYRIFNNEKISGEGWYWKEMTKGNTVSDTFSTPFLSPSPQVCSLKIFAYPNSYSSTIFNEHLLIVRMNSNIIDTLKTNDYKKIDTTIAFQSTLLSSTSVNQIVVTYTSPTGYILGRMYFDMFEVTYPQQFRFTDNKLSFNTNYSDTVSNVYKAGGYVSSNEISIYDITNKLRITNQTYTIDTLIFTGKRNGSFKIVNQYITKKPFRIKHKQVPDLVSTNNEADYLIIYHKLFEQQAEQLRAHRTSKDNFRSVKTEIEDIYDVFNYGVENPIAVRNFVKYVYDNWQLPQVRYICLFGRGSLDPKMNVSTNQYYKNFIPVYGNPPSDGYFANTDLGTFTYYYDISLGRLPAYTQQDAHEFVNKIIDYDNEGFDKWIKEFIFITGGFTRPEQQQYQNQSNSLINNYILPPPISGRATKIYRNDSSGYVTYNYQDSIKNSFNRGALLVNYIGHAATGVWDNGLEDPNILSNGPKLPLVLSMTCFTGKNSEANSRSFGEQFMYLPNKGSIGFVGSTGWSYSTSGNTYNGYLLKGFAEDSLRRIGDIIKYASKLMSPDSLSFASRNTINCFNLLGDPAVKLLLPVYPEFDIRQGDYKLSNPYPSLYEDIILKIFPKNLGTNADSCEIKFQLIKDNQNHSIKDTIIYNFGYIDTIHHKFSLDTNGNYVMKVTLDPDNWYIQEIETNNEITIPIPLRNISYVPLKPIDNSLIKNDSVEFVGINPNIDFQNNSVSLLLQFDTTKQFNSPLNQKYFNNNISGVTTRFRVRIPLLDTNIVYYWRTNAIINNDSAGWSEVKRFLYNPLLTTDNTRRNFKLIQRLDDITSNSDSIITIYKKYEGQYSEYNFENTVIEFDSIKLCKYTGNIYVKSFGQNYWASSFVRINNFEIFLLGDEFNGLNLLKVKRLDGRFFELKNFKVNTVQSSDSIISFLNTFDTTHILIVCKVQASSGGITLNLAAKNKFKEFGSVFVDSVGTFSWFHQWSMISYLGANLPDPDFAESFVYYPGGGVPGSPAISIIQPELQFTFGTIKHKIGPAENWKNFSWEEFIYPNSEIAFDVLGLNKNNQEVVLISNITNNSYVNIENINTYQYPNLKLLTKLSIDTINGYESPVFKSLNFKYQAPPELIPDNNSFIKSDSIIQEGDSITISVEYMNAGYSSISGTINNWSISSPSGISLIKSDTVTNTLLVDSSMVSQVEFSTTGLRNPQKLVDTINVYFETSLLFEENEFFTYNNMAVTQIIIRGDSSQPEMQVTYDGVNVKNGDFIQSKPEIIAKFLDDSKMVINDTSNIKVYLDNIYVPYYIGSAKNPEIDLIFPDNKFLQATVVYKPALSNGEHGFKYIAFDNTGNYADTIQNNLFVSPELRIIDFYNYPNPMTSETYFIFDLAGESIPFSCKVKIFSVSGRLIKVISIPVNIGHNQIFWDGRDTDGDALANGVYFYKMILQGDSKTETSINKLVILK